MDIEAPPPATVGAKRRLDTTAVPPTKATNAGAAAQDAFNEQYLKYYYKHLFPYNAMFRWFAYGNDPDSTNPAVRRDYFLRREFTFTMADDVYIRYLCFRDEAALEKAVNAKQPHKIDIGPVYSAPPNKHEQIKKEAFKAMERELIFDIDLTDYDDVRTCCDGANICRRCWAYMNVAIRVLHASLTEDFGFRNILFVYSGRRGVHCWVCDESARVLTNEARTAIVDYLSAIGTDAAGGGGGGGGTGVSVGKVSSALTTPLHPHFERSYAELEKMFEKFVVPASGQGLFASPAQWKKVLDMLPDVGPEWDGMHTPALRATLEKAWAAPDATPDRRWGQLKQTFAQAVASVGSVSATARAAAGRGGGAGAGGARVPFSTRLAVEKFVPALVFTFAYPRLDVNVSKARNHLLKAPFCVHPKTGRVCVPIDPQRVDEFDPTAVPTVAQLAEQGAAYQKSAAGAGAGGGADGGDGDDGGAARGRGGRMPDMWRHTALKPAIGMLEAFVAGCEREARERMRAANDGGAAFTGAW